MRTDEVHTSLVVGAVAVVVDLEYLYASESVKDVAGLVLDRNCSGVHYTHVLFQTLRAEISSSRIGTDMKS